MNSGRQIFQLSRSVLRQQVQRRNAGTGEQFTDANNKTPNQIAGDMLQGANQEGVRVAKAVFGLAMLWVIGRVSWLHFHVFPKHEEMEEPIKPHWR